MDAEEDRNKDEEGPSRSSQQTTEKVETDTTAAIDRNADSDENDRSNFEPGVEDDNAEDCGSNQDRIIGGEEGNLDLVQQAQRIRQGFSRDTIPRRNEFDRTERSPFDIPRYFLPPLPSDSVQIAAHYRRRWVRANFSVDQQKDGAPLKNEIDSSLSLVDFNECFLCNSTRPQRYPSICRHCYRDLVTPSSAICIFRANYKVWKTFMRLKQIEYQSNLGHIKENEGESVHIAECSIDMSSTDQPPNHRSTQTTHFQQQEQVLTPELLLLKRVKACIGWAVHGIVTEFIDGTRAGIVNGVNSLYSNQRIAFRQGTDWFDIETWDHVRAVSGFHLSETFFLCHTLRLEMASGRTIEFASSHDPWRGDSFRYVLPESSLLHYVSFRAGKCIGVYAHKCHLHLPVRRWWPSLEGTDPGKHILNLWLCIRRFDHDRAKNGGLALGKDIWFKIVFDYLRVTDLQPYEDSTVGRLKECHRLEASREERIRDDDDDDDEHDRKRKQQRL
mmetsp:Transcript_2942/g.6794  ORF Transcript_2942/g.6794 Transcript_2942/m.6794 type:complete len:501 (+) Transcript_2942:454-1956(+)